MTTTRSSRPRARSSSERVWQSRASPRPAPRRSGKPRRCDRTSSWSTSRSGEESGFDLARRLVEDDLGDKAPVVLISTRAEEDVVDLLAASPAAGFIPKAKLSASAIRRIVEGPLH